MRILQISNPRELAQILRDIRVDAYGIRIMLPKAITHLVRINSISNIAANILKQEMLSLGGDAAVARGALTGKTKQTDCLLMGNLAQFNRLNLKLQKQPFGLDKLSRQLSDTLSNYRRSSFIFNPDKFRLNLGRRTHIMGIMNVTPDSFSGDGLYHYSVAEVVARAKQLVDEGADIIDVGGESSRPGSKPVALKEELTRTVPVIKSLARRVKVPISIDTRKPEVARQALDNGAVIVNDITGLRNVKMARLVAKYKAGAVIMHMQGRPGTMQVNPEYESLIDDIIAYLDTCVRLAIAAGVDESKIIIDPGIGFGKTSEHNLEILKKLGEFRVLGKPILVGPSRKLFLGKILRSEPQQRVFGTVSACVLAAKNGANLVRVHDVKAVKEALKVLDAVDKI
jgi:dihydropteroate synthase